MSEEKQVMPDELKGQARKNLMATLQETESLAANLRQLGCDLKAKKIDRMEAETLNKVYGNGVSLLNGAIRAVVTQ
jgi:hypothetical protein